MREDEIESNSLLVVTESVPLENRVGLGCLREYSPSGTTRVSLSEYR